MNRSGRAATRSAPNPHVWSLAADVAGPSHPSPKHELCRPVCVFVTNTREATMQGSCLCGVVEFRVEGIFPKAYQCHCSLCRKQGGASASLAILVEARNFSWVTGREHISSYVRPTGFRSDFCARCGSPVPNPLRTTAYYWVPAGLLDDAETLEIGAHLYTGSKASWETIPSDAPHFETVPKLSQLMELLSPRR